ncbi:MAG: PH domain-containing protein [Candidatus Heimdallarchaeota archaeon]|nr:PH domain-containing protein [Candidatus Heimdallarchaeota archaeon]
MPSVSAILKSVQHPIRREILAKLNNHSHPISHSELLELTENSTGKLNFHLKSLSDLIDKQDAGYTLTQTGINVVKWLQGLISEGEPQNMDRPKAEVIYPQFNPVRALLLKYLIIYLTVLLISISPVILTFSLVNLWNGLMITATILSILLISTLAYWLMRMYYGSIWYQITETEVIVSKGIITKTLKIVPFRTITNLDIARGPFDRIFGISTLNIHTAGQTTVVAEERLVGLMTAEEIKETILERIRLLNPPEFISTQTGTVNSNPDLTELIDEFRDINQKIRNNQL